MDKEDHKSKPERIIPEEEHHPEEERRERGKGKDLEQGSEQVTDQGNIRKSDEEKDYAEGYERMKNEDNPDNEDNEEGEDKKDKGD